MNLRQIYYKKQYKIVKFEQFMAELQAFKVIFNKIGHFMPKSGLKNVERIFFLKKWAIIPKIVKNAVFNL